MCTISQLRYPGRPGPRQTWHGPPIHDNRFSLCFPLALLLFYIRLGTREHDRKKKLYTSETYSLLFGVTSFKFAYRQSAGENCFGRWVSHYWRPGSYCLEIEHYEAAISLQTSRALCMRAISGAIECSESTEINPRLWNFVNVCTGGINGMIYHVVII